MLVDASWAVGELTDSLGYGTSSGSSGETRTAECDDPDAVAAGTITASGTLQAQDATAVVCFPPPGAPATTGGAYGVTTVAGQRIAVLTDRGVLSNERLADEGNAALALRILGVHERLVWYIPSEQDREPVEPGAPAITGVVPPVVWVLGLQLLLVAAVAAFWRGRRLGRVVTEKLPVVVRSGETTRGRGRLYRRSRSFGHAAAALRAGTTARSCARLGLPALRDPAGRHRRAGPRVRAAAHRDRGPPLRATTDRRPRPRAAGVGTGLSRERGSPTVSNDSPQVPQPAPQGSTWPPATPAGYPPAPAPAPAPRPATASPSHELRAALASVRAEVAKAVVGQDAAISGLVIALLCRGHVLLEGVPGVAKTLLVRSLSAALDLDTKRVQFTPDLMPGDVTGSLVYDARTAEFSFRKGPVFTNLLLADEINRTPPKTQASLLEAMEERQVSVDGTPRPLPDPFLVIATQNPIEYEGTYTLPEAQLDRFLLKLVLGLPERDEEIEVLRRHSAGFDPRDLRGAGVRPVASAAMLAAARAEVARVQISPEVLGYTVDVCRATRRSPSLSLGVSPRGATALLGTSRAWAWLSGRGYVTPDDVKALAHPTLRHRVQLRPEAELEGVSTESVLDTVLASVPVPR